MNEFLTQFAVMFLAGLVPLTFFASSRKSRFFDWFNERRTPLLSIKIIYLLSAFLAVATGTDVATTFSSALGVPVLGGSIGFGAAISFFILRRAETNNNDIL